MDIGIQFYEVLQTTVDTSSVLGVHLQLGIELSGSRTLTPSSDPADVYSIDMYLSRDNKLDEDDLKVKLKLCGHQCVTNVNQWCHSDSDCEKRKLSNCRLPYREIFPRAKYSCLGLKSLFSQNQCSRNQFLYYMNVLKFAGNEFCNLFYSRFSRYLYFPIRYSLFVFEVNNKAFFTDI